MRTKSADLFAKALRLMPGGVNSPVRAFRAVGGDPLFIASGRGSRVTDVDGNSYIDYVGSWGPLILGHCHAQVMEAVARVLATGTSFGACTAAEVELAEQINRAFPSVERVRLVSSGTEATLAALRVARAATSRDKILKFEGCYHGHSDSLLVKAGSGVATLGLPDSPGWPSSRSRRLTTTWTRWKKSFAFTVAGWPRSSLSPWPATWVVWHRAPDSSRGFELSLPSRERCSSLTR